MTTPPNDYADLLHGQDDPALARLVADIDQALRAPAPPPALRFALQRELHQRTGVAPHPRRPRTGRLSWRPTRRWAASLGAALVLAVSGVIGYLRLAPPTPVSAAQLVLRHAAAVFRAVPPDQASHAIYTMTPAPPSTSVYLFGVTAPMGTLDTWIQLDTGGAVAQQATTIYSGTATTATTATMVNRIVQTGQTAMIYDVQAGTVMTTTVPADDLSSYHLFNAAGLYRFVQAAAQDSAQHARLLPQQTLDGHSVDVVEIDQPRYQEKETLYIDARTYVLRQLDAATVTAAGVPLDAFTLHLLRADTIPLSSVSDRTFALDAPASARVVQSNGQGVSLSVAQAVALSDNTAPVLSGHPAGLRLDNLTKGTDFGPFTRVVYDYQVSQHGQSQSHYKSFSVTMFFKPSGTAGTVSAPDGAQLITLSVAGQTVQAKYATLTGVGPENHEVVYQQGTTPVQLESIGLSKHEFFAVVRALVNGRTHPDVIAQLQQELGATQASR